MNATAAAGTTAASTTAAAPTANDKVETEATALARTIADLPAEEAATRWLDLSDHQRAGLKSDPRAGGRFDFPVRFEKVVTALPTAAQLPALKAELEKRPLNGEGGQRVAFLKMLVATLQNDSAGMDGAFKDLQTAALAKGSTQARIDARFAEFKKELAGLKQDSSESVANFEAQLKYAAFRELAGEMYVPDLVTLAGEPKARELLTKALDANAILNIGNGDATKKLARERALAMIDSAKVPQWGLCQDINAVDLYEATDKKFPPPAAPTKKPAAVNIGQRVPVDADDFNVDQNERKRGEAKPYYAIGLIARGRSDDAFEVAVQLASEDVGRAYQLERAVEQMAKHGMAEQVYQFLKRVAAADPQTPFWGMLVSTAAQSGHADEVLQVARTAAAKPGQDAAAQQISNGHLADALLATDKVDEAVALLKKNIDADTDAKAKIVQQVRLATIGRIIGQADLVASSLDAATKLMLQSDDKGLDSRAQGEWAREMRIAGRRAELITVLGQQIGAMGTKESAPSFTAPAPLQQLAEAYYTAGSAKDLFTLFDSFPQWGKADVADLGVGGSMHDSSSPPTFFLAWALFRTGQHDAGMKVLEYLLDRRGGLDAAYVMLLQNDPDPMKKLDAMAAQDPFEERPLIWKAVLQRKAGQLDDAEKTLRQAITIDPSDGEEGKGDRMRVYSVLAEVLDQKGDAKQAEFFRQVVQSIRMSEDADDAWEAGLLNRAVAAYTAALTHFADAYCIQSRLAVHLASMGREAEAEAHYQKAYELMPDSFGRVESHCFGCEGAFRSANAQGIAERVFTQLLDRNPLKPQLHYLLGYLRTEQDRYADALPSFRMAVTLDPKYLNAWSKLLACEEHVTMPAKDRDDATIAILQLDPLGRHVSPSVSKVQDVARLYAVACDAAKAASRQPASIYPLPAAAAKLAADKLLPNHQSYQSFFTNYHERKSPAELIANNERLRRIMGWVDQFGQ